MRQAVGREVAVRVEVVEPARDLAEQLELGLIVEGVRVRVYNGGERAAPHGAVGAGLDAGLHREKVKDADFLRLRLRAVDPDHVRVLRGESIAQHSDVADT